MKIDHKYIERHFEPSEPMVFQMPSNFTPVSNLDKLPTMKIMAEFRRIVTHIYDHGNRFHVAKGIDVDANPIFVTSVLYRDQVYRIATYKGWRKSKCHSAITITEN